MTRFIIVIMLSALSSIGCSGVVHTSFYTVAGFSNKISKEAFLISFSETMKMNGFSIKIMLQEKQKDDNKVIRTDNATYYILLEAEKESFRKSLIVRVCENQSKATYIQIVQGTIFLRDDEKKFDEENKKINLLFKKRFPSLKIERKRTGGQEPSESPAGRP